MADMTGRIVEQITETENNQIRTGFREKILNSILVSGGYPRRDIQETF